MSRPEERLHKLDPELLSAYTATPWIIANEATVPAIRTAGGVSAAAAVPDGVEVIDVEQDGVQGKLYRKISVSQSTPCLVWFHVSCFGDGFRARRAEVHETSTGRRLLVWDTCHARWSLLPNCRSWSDRLCASLSSLARASIPCS